MVQAVACAQPADWTWLVPLVELFESVPVAVAQDQDRVVRYARFEAGDPCLECALHPAFLLDQRIARDVHCRHATTVVRHFADFDLVRMLVEDRPAAFGYSPGL